VAYHGARDNRGFHYSLATIWCVVWHARYDQYQVRRPSPVSTTVVLSLAGPHYVICYLSLLAEDMLSPSEYNNCTYGQDTQLVTMQ
jgi:hypothetical protein